MVKISHNYIFAPPTGKWYRVIKRTKTQLTLDLNGIEIPNAQCIYIQVHQFEITEEHAKQYHDLYIDWKTARDNNIAAKIDPAMPTVSFLGFNIDTEDGQTNKYWYDYQTSMETEPELARYVMKRLI